MLLIHLEVWPDIRRLEDESGATDVPSGSSVLCDLSR